MAAAIGTFGTHVPAVRALGLAADAAAKTPKSRTPSLRLSILNHVSPFVSGDCVLWTSFIYSKTSLCTLSITYTLWTR